MFSMTFTGHLTDDGTRTDAWDTEQHLMCIGHTGTGRSTSFRYDVLRPAHGGHQD